MSFGDAGVLRRGGSLVAALVALVLMLALPAIAEARTFEVDSVADETDKTPGDGTCETNAGKCTLRAAIQESNGFAGTDRVHFEEEVFEGQLADTISLTLGPLPPIVQNIAIEAHSNCATQFGVSGPCVGVDGAPAGAALTVENTNGVEIEGLAVTGAQTGINIIGGSEEVRIRSSWFGVKLDGSAGGNTTGVFIDPESNRDRIGGEGAGTGNVFANNAGDGLHVLGADETLVLGNWFGVKPGTGAVAAANGKDIEVNSTSAGGFEASGTRIGKLQSGKAATPACDGGCNVISGAVGSGIDLQGDGGQEAPAVATTITSNFIGLSADGNTVVGNGFAGVLVGDATGTTVGGFGAEDEEGEDANYIAGGNFGIYHENADNLHVLGNEIGFNREGTEVTPPSQVGIFVFCLSTTVPATVEENAIQMSGGVGIEQRFLGATIAANYIVGGLTGILTTGSAGEGNLIEENLIEDASGNGIKIKSDNNEVVGNEIVGSGAAGIRVQHAEDEILMIKSPTTGNRVGGEGEENAIFGSGGDAIEVVDFEETANEVGPNFGSGNVGLFIDLSASNPGTEPNGPNEGIKPPTLTAAKQSSASGGGALPGATVRVFRKASPATGELASFLGKAVADGSGNWKVTYGASIPAGTIVAANQTSEPEAPSPVGGSSELVTATTVADPSSGGGTGGSGGGTTTSVADTKAPQAKILKGPKAKSHSTTAKFKFNSNEAGSRFQCKLDKKPFKGCKSPQKYKKLKPGKHVFKVRAIDPAGNVGAAVKRKFTVLK